MRKKLFVILVITACVFFSGCKNEQSEENITETVVDEINEEDSKEIDEKQGKTEENTVSEWQYDESLYIEKEGNLRRVWFKLPVASGYECSTSIFSTQGEDVTCIFDAEHEIISPQIDNMSYNNAFPDFFEQTSFILQSHYETSAKDFEFTIDSKENVEINGYDICIYRGIQSCVFNNDEQEERNNKYVMYVTNTKTNGALIYWMMIDWSKEQKANDKIEEYAAKLAETLKEE